MCFFHDYYIRAIFTKCYIYTLRCWNLNQRKILQFRRRNICVIVRTTKCLVSLCKIRVCNHRIKFECFDEDQKQQGARNFRSLEIYNVAYGGDVYDRRTDYFLQFRPLPSAHPGYYTIIVASLERLRSNQPLSSPSVSFGAIPIPRDIIPMMIVRR